MLTTKRCHEAQVAREMWEHDGEPDGHDATESHRGTYEQWTKDVFDSLDRLGLKVVKA